MSTRTSTRPQISGRRVLLHGAVGAAALATLALGLAGTASAATDGGSTSANVAVASALTLTGLTPSFQLSGIPGSTQTGTGAVAFNVATNNIAGYAVTVQSATATMAGTGTNTETIPIDALTVRETGATTYNPLSATTPVTVHTQGTHSLEAGDALTNDFQIAIPFVNSDTYTATLNYVATTL